MTAAITDDWTVVRNHSNWRVVRNPGPNSLYHRGSNGAVRAYRDEQAAQRRADILNGKTSEIAEADEASCRL